MEVMSEKKELGTASTPRHLWVVGIIALLWNAMGALDFVMTQTKNEAYMGEFTPEQLDFFYGFPLWLVVFWGVAVWGGVIGAVVLLLKNRLAVPIFLASLIAMLTTTFHNFVLSNGMEIMGVFGAVFTGVIFVIALALFLYARSMQARGVLK